MAEKSVLTTGYWEKDCYVPLDGERIRHKYYGHEGKFVEFVYTNKSRRHTRIITDAGNTICLPANEWEPAKDDQQLPG
jgi:hypothetical protein